MESPLSSGHESLRKLYPNNYQSENLVVFLLHFLYTAMACSCEHMLTVPIKVQKKKKKLKQMHCTELVFQIELVELIAIFFIWEQPPVRRTVYVHTLCLNLTI